MLRQAFGLEPAVLFILPTPSIPPVPPLSFSICVCVCAPARMCSCTLMHTLLITQEAIAPY